MKIFLFLLLLFSLHCNAQLNLVLNPSFELLDSCPPSITSLGGGTIKYANSWFTPFSYTNSGGSAEMFTNCTSDINFNSPSNIFGYQSPHSGNNYGGFYLIVGAGREYLENSLSDTLQAGIKYCVEFWYSFADSSKSFTNDMGVYFTKDSLMRLDSTFKVISVYPQVNTDSASVIIDTMNWLHFSEQFIASGGEKYFTVGCFKKNQKLNIVEVTPIPSARCYIYVDDFALYSCFNVGVESQNKSNNDLEIFPNPAKESITLKSSIQMKEVRVFDIVGREVERTNINSSNYQLNTSNIKSGVYFVEVLFTNGERRISKLVIE
jgi:hypothetical protein